MILTVSRVTIPAMSTIGYGIGENENGVTYRFCGDHRPMRYLGEAVSRGEEPEVDVDDWQIVSVLRNTKEVES